MVLVEKIYDKLLWVVKYICFGLFTIMIIDILATVIMRYIFDTGLTWAEEVGKYSSVWITFLGASIATYEASHAEIIVFIQLFPKWAQKIAQILVQVILLACCCVFFWYGIPLVQMTINDLSPGMHLRLGLVYLALPVSFGIMVPGIILRMIRILHPKSEETDSAEVVDRTVL